MYLPISFKPGNFWIFFCSLRNKKIGKFVIYGQFLAKEQLLLLIIYIDSAFLGSPNSSCHIWQILFQTQGLEQVLVWVWRLILKNLWKFVNSETTYIHLRYFILEIRSHSLAFDVNVLVIWSKINTFNFLNLVILYLYKQRKNVKNYECTQSIKVIWFRDALMGFRDAVFSQK